MYAFTYDVPIDAAFYRRIVDGLGEEAPKGFLVHVATELPRGGLRYLDVWESKEDWDRFEEERLHPVVHPLLAERLGFVPPEPERTFLTVLHLWTGGDATNRLLPA